jgi:putative flippase GtrA
MPEDDGEVTVRPSARPRHIWGAVEPRHLARGSPRSLTEVVNFDEPFWDRRCATTDRTAANQAAAGFVATLRDRCCVAGMRDAAAYQMFETEFPSPIRADGQSIATQAPPPLAHRVIPYVEGRRAIKYGLVGVTNVAIDFSLYALLVSAGLFYPLAKTLSLIAATINGYTWNRAWTFRAGRHRNETLAKYVGVQAGCLVANVALLALLVEVAGTGAVTAQVIAFPVVAGVSFIGNRLWTFGSHVGTGG